MIDRNHSPSNRRTHWPLLLLFALALGVFHCGELLAQTAKDRWVDSVMGTMSTSQKIGQLFVVPVSTRSEMSPERERVLKNGLGGILISGGHPKHSPGLINDYQRMSVVPVLVAMDAASRLPLDSVLQYPLPFAQTALRSDSLITAIGRRIGYEMKIVGANFNIGIPASLAQMDENQTWSLRYSDKRSIVARNASAFIKGLRSEGILTGATGFQLGGLTVKDLVKDLPVVETSSDTSTTSLFRTLIDNGLHAVVPSANTLPIFIEKKNVFKKKKPTASMLSGFYSVDWLRNRMNFQGLVIVDLRLTGTESGKFRNGDAELYAFAAGNDLIITSEKNINAAARKIKRKIKKSSSHKLQLNVAVKKILSAKYEAGLNVPKVLSSQNVMLRLKSPEAEIFERRLQESATTVVKNERNILPLKTLENKSFATLSLGDTTEGNQFQRVVSKYVPSKHFVAKDEKGRDLIRRVFRRFSTVLVIVNPATTKGQLDTLAQVKKELGNETEIIVADLGCHHLYHYLKEFETVITVYENSRSLQKLLPQAIFGAYNVTGHYPLHETARATATSSLSRVQYSFPEDAGLSSGTLKKIDAIAKEAIDIGGTPGCHVFVARKGKVIFEKSYGHHTYEKVAPVTDSTIYDLASVTKVSATLQAVMFLYDRRMIDLYKKASVYLPELNKSNKKDAILKDILTHQAGLWPFLPFWAQTMKDTTYFPQYYSRKLSLDYPLMVGDRLYGSRSMPDSLWSWTIKSKLREKPTRTPYDYKYSDMSFYIMHRLSERLLNQNMDDFLAQNLYEPLGAGTTGFRPLLNFPVNRIAPTENDKLFRRSLLTGTVHDQGAAMHGGVAGHAGLFSTANDLGKLGQMLLQQGYYGGYQFYRPETVALFGKKQFKTSKRGLGWDRPTPSDNVGVTSVYASQNTFGHTGFTGTCIWIDPDFELVYIFLSNRVHPDMNNNKLLNANIRSRIQDVIYESIFDYCAAGRRSLFSPPPPSVVQNGGTQ